MSVEAQAEVELRDVVEDSEAERGQHEAEQEEEAHAGFVECLPSANTCC